MADTKITLYSPEPVTCQKCDRELHAFAILWKGRVLGYYCAVAEGYQEGSLVKSGGGKH